MKKLLFLVVFIIPQFSPAAVWQWSVEVKGPVSTETNAVARAFLWIPEDCKQVKGVIVGQHNMSEEGILEHPDFRKGMCKLGFAEVWISPGFAMTFDFHKGAGEVFEQLMVDLAGVSGYEELATAPIVPIGHSAYASYPWNFGAWKPERTLAIISEHGDAPLTPLTGSGRPNPNWENRNIEGVPGLMVIGEYEWWMDRVQPALDYKERYPQAPISLLVDAGHGHFDVSDELVAYLVKFLEKAAYYRLPKKLDKNKARVLKPINPNEGWLREIWKKDSIPTVKAAPFDQYKGDKRKAFWYFDKDMAQYTENYYQSSRGKVEQFLGFQKAGGLLEFNPQSHARIVGKFEPEGDGLTFYLKPVFTNEDRTSLVKKHASGKPEIIRICGPVEKVNDTTFSIRFYRMGLNNQKRTGDIWLLARHLGDCVYKSAVQQFNMRIPYPLDKGEKQTIEFSAIPDQGQKVNSISLDARSSLGLPVYFYIQEGPAEVKNGKLVFSKIPPRSKFPIKVTVVAWQYGKLNEIQTAEPVKRSFYINQ